MRCRTTYRTVGRVSKRRRLLITLGGLGGLGLVALGGGALVLQHLVRPALEARITAEAAARGLTLGWGELELWPGRATLRGASVGLRGVPCARLTAERVELTLAGLRVEDARLEDVSVTLACSTAQLTLQLGAWARDHGQALTSALHASPVTLRWSERPDAEPWLVAERGRVERQPSSTTWEVESLTIRGVPLGAATATWRGDPALVRLGLGSNELDAAPLHFTVTPEADPPQLGFELRPTPVAAFTALFGVEAPFEATASGSGRIALPLGSGSAAPLPGTASLTLEGWVPPHPPELQGVITGTKTTLGARLEVSEDRQQLRLSELTVAAGSFKLIGDGRLSAEATGPRLRLELRGAVPCSVLASAVTAQRFGTLAKELLGKAPVNVTGSVTVRIPIDASLHELSALKLEPILSVGCGLQLRQLPELGVLKLGELPRLPVLPGLGLP